MPKAPWCMSGMASLPTPKPALPPSLPSPSPAPCVDLERKVQDSSVGAWLWHQGATRGRPQNCSGSQAFRVSEPLGPSAPTFMASQACSPCSCPFRTLKGALQVPPHPSTLKGFQSPCLSPSHLHPPAPPPQDYLISVS